MKRHPLAIMGTLLCGMTGAVNHAVALDIDSSLSPLPSITANDLQAGPGSKLKVASSSAGILQVTGATGTSNNWRIDVHRIDMGIWPAGLTFSIKRTSDGSGGGLISSGLSFLPVGTSEAAFFYGSGDRTGISFTYQISGLSLSVSPGTYSATLYFSVVDVP